MNCPRCDSVLDDPQAKFCPVCGASMDPGAPAVPGAPGPASEAPGPAAGPPSNARCATHPDRPAVDICSRCGSFACRECLVVGADGQGVCSTCQARQGETEPMAWERRSELGFFKAYWQTCKGVMFAPNTGFARMAPGTGNWWDPLSFAIVSYVFGYLPTMLLYALAIAGGFLAAITQKSGAGDLSGGAAVGVVIGIVVACVIGIPIGAIMNVFMMSGIEHVALRLVGVETRPFEATARAYCYALAPFFWGVVPFCGLYAFPIWSLVCRIFGYKAVHKTTGGKATAGVLLPTGVCCVLGGGVYAILIAVAMSQGH